MKLSKPRQTLLFALVAAVTALVTAALVMLLVNIFERRQEAKTTFVKLAEVGEDDVSAEKWGLNFPRQYDGYRRTAEPTATRYGGGLIGPEGGLPPQKAERYPWLGRLFAGYLFALDYRDRRGHAYMLQDQEVTRRNLPAEGKQSGNCLHCHSSVMPLYRKLGREALPQAGTEEQLQKGMELVGKMGYWEAHRLLKETPDGAQPVSCVDCHDPASMQLRVTRPAFLTAVQKLAASAAPVPYLPSIERWRQGKRAQPYHPNRDATRQEMRSFVCAQCHVEYYCGKDMTIFFPWDEGLAAEQMEQAYNRLLVNGRRFKDWVHAETGVEVLKAQHPEFELWSQGLHAANGVACADCHMPYKREGAMKVSEHWVRSPLLQLNRSCAVCHPQGEKELEARVAAIQDRHHLLLDRAGRAAADMIDTLTELRRLYGEQAWQEALERDTRVKELGELQRAAGWRLDFVAAENSMGFHAPQEAARLLAESIDLSRQAQARALRLLNEKR